MSENIKVEKVACIIHETLFHNM